MKNTRRFVFAGIAAVMLGAFAGAASANTLGVSSGVLDVGSGSIAAPVCVGNQVSINSVRTTYSGGNYNISQVNFNTLNANCRLDPYQIAIANEDGVYASLFEGSGTTPNATGLMTFGAADVNGVNSVNNQVRIYMLVEN